MEQKVFEVSFTVPGYDRTVLVRYRTCLWHKKEVPISKKCCGYLRKRLTNQNLLKKAFFVKINIFFFRKKIFDDQSNHQTRQKLISTWWYRYPPSYRVRRSNRVPAPYRTSTGSFLSFFVFCSYLISIVSFCCCFFFGMNYFKII